MDDKPKIIRHTCAGVVNGQRWSAEVSQIFGDGRVSYAVNEVRLENGLSTKLAEQGYISMDEVMNACKRRVEEMLGL